MKRGKDDEKIMGPMFPRLHVNDADKGGPKAPPRNKMALYEQLSVPSQRFNHQVLPVSSNNANSNSVPPSSQGGGNEKGSFFSYQIPSRHQSEKQYSLYSDVNTKSSVEQRKRSYEDDFTVPIFVHPVANQDSAKHANELSYDKLTPSNPSRSDHPSKFQKPNNINGMQENNTRQESQRRQTDSSTRDSRAANFEDRLRNQDSEEPAVLGVNVITDKRNSCIPSENQNGIFHDARNETGSREDSVSETSVVDSITRVDMTPDDVVGIIGQRHFWKARRAIVNQQRVFAVQVFELHRLVKVQKLIATSPHLMLEDSSYALKQTKPKKIPIKYPVKPIPNVPKPQPEPEKPSHKKESSAENTVGNPSFSSIQNGGGGPTSNNHPNARSSSWCYSQMPPPPPNHHQWLIPVMSPSEGLVYKPYPFVGPPGPNPTMSNFVPPAYGVPAPPFQIPSFSHPGGPHGYFPPYGMPAMNPAPAPFSGSSVEQMNEPAIPDQIPVGPRADISRPCQHGSEDVEVQASTASSPIERQEDKSQGRNVLPLFPTSPTADLANASSEPPSEPEPGPERPTQVIKVVPHNARSATESAARIFRSIQAEREQFEAP